MRTCVRDVFAVYDDNILSRLIMMIIKIIILYFIQIRHTDDFPSAGIPASIDNVWVVHAHVCDVCSVCVYVECALYLC